MRNPFIRAAGLAVLCGSIAAASSIPIVNASFETPEVPCVPGPGCYQHIFDGWTAASFGATAEFRPSVGPGQEFLSIPDGSQVAALSDGLGSGGEIDQVLSATLAADTTYTLTWWVGARTDVPFDPAYSVSLKAGSFFLASSTPIIPGAGAWQQQSITFTTTFASSGLGQQLSINVFVQPNAPGQADFDQFSLTAAGPESETPEPVMFAPAALGLFAVWRRKRAQR